jgi:hypothetical protein
MKGVMVATSSRPEQMIVDWSGMSCYIKGDERFQLSENRLRGNEKETERIKVRFKATLSLRDDNGILNSVTKEGCGLIPLRSTSEAFGNPSSSPAQDGNE